MSGCLLCDECCRPRAAGGPGEQDAHAEVGLGSSRSPALRALAGPGVLAAATAAMIRRSADDDENDQGELLTAESGATEEVTDWEDLSALPGILDFLPFEFELPGSLSGFPLDLQPLVTGGLASVLLSLALDYLCLVLGLLAQTHN